MRYWNFNECAHTCSKTYFLKKNTFLNFLIGSGKTAAFLIPMFERLKAHSAKVVFEFHIDKPLIIITWCIYLDGTVSFSTNTAVHNNTTLSSLSS